MTDRVSERRRAVALARHYRDQEGLAIAEIARRLGRAEGTVKAYLYDPLGAKAREVKASYRGACRGCGAPTSPRGGKGDAYEYCKRCRPGAIARQWTRERVRDAMRAWRAHYGAAPSSYDWSRTHARRRGGEARKRLRAGEWPAPSHCHRSVRELGRGPRRRLQRRLNAWLQCRRHTNARLRLAACERERRTSPRASANRLGEARRREPAIVSQQPSVIRSPQFGDRRRSRPRGRRNYRNRGKPRVPGRAGGRLLSRLHRRGVAAPDCCSHAPPAARDVRAAALAPGHPREVGKHRIARPRLMLCLWKQSC